MSEKITAWMRDCTIKSSDQGSGSLPRRPPSLPLTDAPHRNPSSGFWSRPKSRSRSRDRERESECESESGKRIVLKPRHDQSTKLHEHRCHYCWPLGLERATMLRLTHQVHHPVPMLDLDADSTVPFSIGTRRRGRLSGTVFPNGLTKARVSGSGPENHFEEFEGFWDGTQVRLVNPTDLSDFFLLEAPFAQHNDTDKFRACPLWTDRYPLLQESRDPLWVENTERNRMDGLRDEYLIATADRKVKKTELKGIPEDWSAIFRYRSRTGVVSVGSADRSGRVTVTTAHEVDSELSYTTLRGFYDGREVRVLPEAWTSESQDRPVLFRIPELSKFIENGEHAKKAIKSHKRRNQLLDRETGHDHRIAITIRPDPGVPSCAISRICPIRFSGTAGSDTIRPPSEATVLLWGEKWEENPSWKLHKEEIERLSKYLDRSSLPEEAEVRYVQDSKCRHASFWVHCDPLVNRQIVVEHDIEPTAAWGAMPRHEEEAVFLHDPAAENRERMKFARKHERMKAEAAVPQ